MADAGGTEMHTPEYTKAESVNVRVDHKQKALIRKAGTLTGVAPAAKARELLLEWAARVVKEEEGG